MPPRGRQRVLPRSRAWAPAAVLWCCCAATACGDPPAEPSWPDGAADAEAGDLPNEAELSEVIVISFAIDDSANEAYGSDDGLAWPGQFRYDPETNFILGLDDRSPPPFPMLHDDGPPPRGHEPEGAEAGDHIWSVAVLHPRPSATVSYRYGAMRGSVNGSIGEWIWPEVDYGWLTVPSDAPTLVEARGLTIPPFGRVDYRITVDGRRLDPDFQTFLPGDVRLIGAAWGFAELGASDDGSQDQVARDGVFSFVASDHFGADCTQSDYRFCRQTGLANSGDALPFCVFMDHNLYQLGSQHLMEGVTVEVGRVSDDEGNVVLDWTPVEPEVSRFSWRGCDRALVVTIPQVALSVTLDDSQGRTFSEADGLALAGSFSSDDEVITYDPEWSGPFLPLYDDGPRPGGHEPDGEVADDGVWHLTAWLDSPRENVCFAYRLIRDSVEGSGGPRVTPDDTFTVLAGQVAPVPIDLEAGR